MLVTSRKLGFSALIVLIVLGSVVATILLFVAFDRPKDSTKISVDRELAQTIENAQDQLKELEEIVATQSADPDEIKEASRQAMPKNTYQDDRIALTFQYPGEWKLKPFEYANPLFGQRSIIFQLEPNAFLAQLLIIPNGDLSAYYSTWVYGESKAQEVKKLKIGGQDAIKLRSNHVVHKDSFIYLWKKDNTLFNLFLIAPVDKEFESIVTSVKH